MNKYIYKTLIFKLTLGALLNEKIKVIILANKKN